MNSSNQFLAGIITIALMTGASNALTVTAFAADPGTAQNNATVAQRSFASPDEAIKALQAAAANQDNGAMLAIFGSEFPQLLTGDKVQDADNAQRFANDLKERCTPVKSDEGKITLEVGTNNWPMPIPLVKAGGQWHFDTAAGREEIINRHIGEAELHAIGVCRAYVTAQKQYANMIPKVGGGANYAQKFKSTPGKQDGLYWEPAAGGPTSPFGPLVAEAHADGYGNNKGAGPHPFHGYYFRILTSQGRDAPGGKEDYLSEGVLAGGFALVAYPEHWNQSGIMTFIVNQAGKVYQQNLGEKTAQIGAAMKAYNPDNKWKLVEDTGVMGAVTEK
jgi:hypothetical protein